MSVIWRIARKTDKTVIQNYNFKLCYSTQKDRKQSFFINRCLVLTDLLKEKLTYDINKNRFNDRVQESKRQIYIWFKKENIILQYSSDQEVDTSTNCHHFNPSVENLRPRNFACIIGPSICYVACCVLFETERNCVRNCI